MNPYDPRRPPGPSYPPQQGAPGQQQPYPPQQAPYPQQGQQQPYPQQGQQPYPQQGQQQPYPQQAQQPYPQQVQQPYPQQGQQPQPYGQPLPPKKKGLGTGAIIGIILGVLVVLGGGAALIVLVVLGGAAASTVLADTADNSEALKAKATALQVAIRTKDPKQVEVPLLNFAVLPDKALPWFADRFGTAGADVFSEWDRDVFKELPKLITPFKEADTKGYTQIKVTRLGSAAEIAACTIPFCQARKGQHEKIFKAMKKPTPLYILRFAKPGGQEGVDEDDVTYFAVVNGQMTYIGDLVSLW